MERHLDSLLEIMPESEPPSPLDVLSSPSDVPLQPLLLSSKVPSKLDLHTTDCKEEVVIDLLFQEASQKDTEITFNSSHLSRTSEVIVALLTYCVSSILMTVTNKYVLSSLHFHMNFLLLAIQVSDELFSVIYFTLLRALFVLVCL